jgi:pimeloyl-ACP methyl ester carboxylesterase
MNPATLTDGGLHGTAASPDSAAPRQSGAVLNAAQPSTTQSNKAKPLKRVVHTPQMVVKVRDCPSSQMPIELCYQCFGDPNDGLPPVLLICGLNMQLYAWDEEFCESLVRAGFYVIRYDNRDMGHSTKIERRGRVKAPLLLLPGSAATWLGEKLPYSIEDMAADAWALLDTLNIPCAHLFGISMGGMIAQTAALLAPERTISLTSVMSSTNAPDLPQPQLWVKLWMLRKPPRNCTVDELLEFRVNSLRRLLRSALPPDGDYLKKRYLMSLKRSSYAAGLVRQAATIRRAVGRDAALQKLYVPALVVHGAQDVVVPPMHGYRTATMLPYARMLVLKSMGHYFHPAFFSTIIEAFADMAASTDPARRGLSSRLPSVTAMPVAEVQDTTSMEDGNMSAAAAWRRGGGSVTSSSPRQPREGSAELSTDHSTTLPTTQPLDNGSKPAEKEEGEASQVDSTTLMMASMGAFIQPVVADASSPVGMAACRSVMVAVPGGSSNPGVPEAVIVENMFLRTPHAVPSVPTPTVVKKPVSQTSSPTSRVSPNYSTSAAAAAAAVAESPRASCNSSTVSSAARLSATSPATSPIGTEAKLFASSLATGEKKRMPATSAGAAGSDAGTTTPTPPKPLPMDGAVPYVPCSPSRWYEVAPFPQRSATTTQNSAKGGTKQEVTAPPSTALATPYPKFHPVVVGVPVSEYLDTHPMERETSGLAMTATNVTTIAAAAGFDDHSRGDGDGSDEPRDARLAVPVPTGSPTRPSSRRQRGSPSEASWVSATTLTDATSSGRREAVRAYDAAEPLLVGCGTEGGKEEEHAYSSGAGGGAADGGHRPTSRSSSQESRENESFLQSQAPAEVVEASVLPSL